MNSRRKIKFSILIPVYNVEKYIRECIDSVLAQSYSEYEIIVVDDGSTDNSGIICDEYASQYSTVKVFHKPNKGLIHTRRFAINKASGDYYVMVDSDDYIEPQSLQILSDTILKHNCDCVFFNRKVLKNNEIIHPQYHIKEEYTDNKKRIIRKALIEMPYNGIVLKCAKASLFTINNYESYYHIQKSEDLLQTLEILKNCRSAEFIDEELYVYRMREGSIIKSQTEVGEIDFTVRKKTLEFILEEDAFDKGDMCEYRDKCIELFINQLIDISMAQIEFSKKIRIMQETRRDEYYSTFLNEGIHNDRKFGMKKNIYNMYNAGLYIPIIIAVNLYCKAREGHFFDKEINSISKMIL